MSCLLPFPVKTLFFTQFQKIDKSVFVYFVLILLSTFPFTPCDGTRQKHLLIPLTPCSGPANRREHTLPNTNPKA